MYSLIKDTLLSQVVTLWGVFKKLFVKADTVEYPDQQPYVPPLARPYHSESRSRWGRALCCV